MCNAVSPTRRICEEFGLPKDIVDRQASSQPALATAGASEVLQPGLRGGSQDDHDLSYEQGGLASR